MTMWTAPDLVRCCLCGIVRPASAMTYVGDGQYRCKGVSTCLNRVRRSEGQLLLSTQKRRRPPKGTLAGRIRQLVAAMAGIELPRGTIAATLKQPIASMTGVQVPRGTIAATLQRLTAAMIQIPSATVAATAKQPTVSMAGLQHPRGAMAMTMQKPLGSMAGEHRPYETVVAAIARAATASMTGVVGVSSPATFGAAGTASTGGNSITLLIPVPSGVVAGSAVVVLIYVETSQAVTPPAGFTQAPSSPVITTGTQAHYLRIYEHVATGSESGNYTFTIASGLVWRNGHAVRIDSAGQLSGSIFDVTNSAGKSTTTDGTIPAVSVTTSGVNRLLLWCAGNFAGAPDTVPPTGFTEQVQQDGYEISSKLQAASGASGSLTGSLTAGYSSATTAWVGAILPGVTTGSGGGSYDITGATYYVSGTGNDANNGLSPASAWRTVSRAMQASYTAGDGLLFERGSTYFYNTIDKTPTASGTKRWIIGAYGTGAKPIMSHYKFANLSGGWVLHSTGVWKINLGDSTTHTGYNSGSGLYAAVGNYASTGFLMIDGVMKVNKKSSLAGLSAQWDFYNDLPGGGGGYLYVRSTANPTTLASDIQIATDNRQMYLRNNMEVRDLEFCGTAGSCLDCTYAVTNILIKGNYCHHIGGSYLGVPDPTTQWGNGVTVWAGSSNWLVTENEFAYTYDCGVGIQGPAAGVNNIQFTYNTFHNCSQAYELAPFSDAGTFSDCGFEYNTCYDSGENAWGPTIPNQDRRNAIMVTWNGGSLVNCRVRFNTIIGAHVYRFDLDLRGGGSGLDTPVVHANNDIRLAAGTKLAVGRTYTIEQGAAFVAATGDEIGSTFTVL